MKIYHGTAEYSLKGFLNSEPKKYIRSYLPLREACFSCSTAFEEAAKFALRRTPANDLSKTGIVLEFLVFDNINRKEFLYCQDPKSFIDEKEIVIFNVKKIKLVAVHQFKKDTQIDIIMNKMGYPTEDWERQEL